MIRELDLVVLTRAVPEAALAPGDVGTVVMVHGEAAGYEVKFVTLGGDTVAVATLEPCDIRLVDDREIAHARAVV
jgi:hypothetical protein